MPCLISWLYIWSHLEHSRTIFFFPQQDLLEFRGLGPFYDEDTECSESEKLNVRNTQIA